MNWRVVAPAYSALPLGAVLAGAAGWLGRDAREKLGVRLRQRVSAADVVLTDSGTSALQLAISAACLSSGRRTVALPTWACFDVLSAAMGAAAEPLFYDLDPNTLLPTAETVSAVGAAMPAAMVVVHPFGIAADVAALRQHLPSGIQVIEDAAQAWGSAFLGAPVGCASDSAVFSFGRGKGLTGGSGGAWLRREKTSEIPPLPQAGGARDVMVMTALTVLTPPLFYSIPSQLPFLKLGETQFRPPRVAAGISRAAAAAVLAGLTAGDAASHGRNERASALRRLVADKTRLQNISVVSDSAPSWLRLPLLADDSAARDALVADGRPLGAASSYPRTLPSLATELGVKFRLVNEDLGGRIISQRLFTVPTHAQASREDWAKLERWLEGCEARASVKRR